MEKMGRLDLVCSVFNDLIERERKIIEEIDSMILHRKKMLTTEDEDRCKALEDDMRVEIEDLEKKKCKCLENIERWEKESLNRSRA